MSLSFKNIACLGDALKDGALQYRGNVALYETDREKEKGRWTYEQFMHESERVAALLQDAKLKALDRVAILMSNQSKWLFSATGAFWSGLTLVPLDYKLTASEQAALIAHARPKALIVEWPIWLKLKGLVSDTLVFVTEAPDGADLGQAKRWEIPPKKTARYIRASREDVACIVYSSGTGGRAKGCMLTHHSYLSQAEQLAKLFPMAEDDRYFSILPTNHAIDFMCGYFLPLCFGGAIVHQRTLRPEFLASTMKRYGITHMALVPLILRALEKKIREKVALLPKAKRLLIESLIAANAALTDTTPHYRLSRLLLKPIHDQFGGRLRLMFAGGSFVDPGSAEYFYRLGLPVVIGYGLTEACTVLTVNDLKPFRSDTVGKPLHGIELQVRKANDQGVGEVWASGPTIMKGYLDDPELTGEILVNGWLRTGDLGVMDPTGHLKLVGRAKNMIVTEGGKNIYPEDIETSFEDLAESQEQAVFAANYVWPTQGFKGDDLMIVVRPKPGSDYDRLLTEIRERNRKLADFKRLHGYVVWEKEFPRTASMKVKRNHLAEELKIALKREEALREL